MIKDIEKCQENLKISYNYSLVPSLSPKIKILSILAKNSENKELNFSVVSYFAWNLKFVSNILFMILVIQLALAAISIIAFRIPFHEPQKYFIINWLKSFTAYKM